MESHTRARSIEPPLPKRRPPGTPAVVDAAVVAAEAAVAATDGRSGIGSSGGAKRRSQRFSAGTRLCSTCGRGKCEHERVGRACWSRKIERVDAQLASLRVEATSSTRSLLAREEAQAHLELALRVPACLASACSRTPRKPPRRALNIRCERPHPSQCVTSSRATRIFGAARYASVSNGLSSCAAPSGTQHVRSAGVVVVVGGGSGGR